MKNKEIDDQPGKPTRLNKLIASAGFCSRRKADEYIAKGLVKVNGKVVKELGTKVTGIDRVTFKGTPVISEKLRYVLLNKPKDFITTTSDERGRKTVMDLIKTACKEAVLPVGRLDRNTTGVLLFTNDGELAKSLTHPSGKVSKIYKVELNKGLEEEHLKKITGGVELEDGPVVIDTIYILSKDKKEVGIELHIGRNRIVRRLFENFGYEIEKLDRVSFAGLTKKDLPRGKWRLLNDGEIRRLKHFL